MCLPCCSNDHSVPISMSQNVSSQSSAWESGVQTNSFTQQQVRSIQAHRQLRAIISRFLKTFHQTGGFDGSVIHTQPSFTNDIQATTFSSTGSYGGGGMTETQVATSGGTQDIGQSTYVTDSYWNSYSDWVIAKWIGNKFRLIWIFIFELFSRLRSLSSVVHRVWH